AIEQPDGKIIVAGHSVRENNGGEMRLQRYNLNGSVDHDFNNGKPLDIDLNHFIEQPASLALQDDGQILILSNAHEFNDFDQTAHEGAFITRITASGKIDASFGTNGSVKIGKGVDFSLLHIYSNGDIAATSDASEHIHLTPAGAIIKP